MPGVNLKDMLTPTEIINTYPEYNYNARELGYMLMCGLVVGHKGKYQTWICVKSFKKLMDFREANGLIPQLSENN